MWLGTQFIRDTKVIQNTVPDIIVKIVTSSNQKIAQPQEKRLFLFPEENPSDCSDFRVRNIIEVSWA